MPKGTLDIKDVKGYPPQQYFWLAHLLTSAEAEGKTLLRRRIKERGIVEWQANEFAGLVLVPRRILISEFKKAQQEAREIVEVPSKDTSDIITDVTINLLGGRFGVSDDVIRIRAERDKLIR